MRWYGLLSLVTGGILMTAVSTRGQLLGAPTQRDVEQGTEAAKQIEKQIGLYSQAEAESYLREVGARVAAAANDPRWKFTFQIADQKEPNAFSIPGGGIYISRGLLALVNSEDELAGVLAHEIMHVTQRHSARQQSKGILPGLLSLPGNLVGGVVSENLGALINAPVDVVGGAWLSRYSRGQETEADRLGIRAAAQCGYDPAALAGILARIEEAVNTQTGEERRFSIFDSHPMTETRFSDIRKRAGSVKTVTKAPVAPDRTALFAKFDGMWWGENPDNGVLQKDRFMHPGVGFRIDLPAGWKHRNTPQYVISAHPKQEAMLLLGIQGPPSDPEEIGEKFVAYMRAKARIEPATTRKTSLGEFPAYVVTYVDQSGRAPVYLHFAWVTMGEETYQIIGLAPEKDQQTLRDAALTLRPLGDTDRSAIKGKRLRTAVAQKGETLANFGTRTGNVWPATFTAIANGISERATLEEGQVLKIAREEGTDRRKAP